MSKHLGNVVDPDELVERYGADTVRLAVLYAAGPAKTLNWNDRRDALRRTVPHAGVGLPHRCASPAAGRRPAMRRPRPASSPQREHLGGNGARMGEKITEDLEGLEMHSAVRNVIRLFDRIKDFDKRVVTRQGALGRADCDALLDALALLAQLLGPFAPHMAEELLLEPRQGGRCRAAPIGPAVETHVAGDVRAQTGNRQAEDEVRQGRRPTFANLEWRGPMSLRPPTDALVRDGAGLPRCGNVPAADTVFRCPDCDKGLDIVYDYELPASASPSSARSERPQNIWRFEELLPIVDLAAPERVGTSGYTPLIRAERLGAELGIANLYLKDDSSNRPELSYKDRVVAMSVARLLERGKTEIGCVSTGNVGTAVASSPPRPASPPTSSTPTWRR